MAFQSQSDLLCWRKRHSEAVLIVSCWGVSEPSEDHSYIQATLSSLKISWWVAKQSFRDLYFVSWWYFSLGNSSWRNMENGHNFASRKENWLTPFTNFAKIFNKCHNQIFKELVILSLLPEAFAYILFSEREMKLHLR